MTAATDDDAFLAALAEQPSPVRLAPPAQRRPWQQVDLAAVLDGSWLPPTPSIGSRSDGVGLFYRAKVHTIHSPTEAGKTWFALGAAAQEIAAGGHVVYVDFEDDEAGVAGRLLAMQAAHDDIAGRFHYLQPTAPLTEGRNTADLAELINTNPTSLVVIDGVTEAMTVHGLNPLDNKDVATFGRLLPRPATACKPTPAVVLLDHVVKDRENRGRYALGGVHKLNGLDGAAYVIESRTPIGVGLTGTSTVRIAKDRPGQLRRHGLRSSDGMSWFADLVVTSHADAFVEVQIAAPSSEPQTERPTVLMRRIAEALERHGPLSQRKLISLIRGKTQHIGRALTYLQLEGYVSDASPHQLLKPYPEADQ